MDTKQLFYKLRREQSIALSAEKAETLCNLVTRASNVPGILVEVGVYKGGSARLINMACPEKELYLFDTFCGMPSPNSKDHHRECDFSDTSKRDVEAHFNNKSVSVVEGKFPQTAENIGNLSVAFAHVDVDLFKSTYEALRYIWPKLNKDGMILIDDYTWSHCPGVKDAVRTFEERCRVRGRRVSKYQYLFIK